MKNSVQPLKVIVCGTTFGRIYLAGISRLPGKFELAGILARGSDNAKACARKYRVPLYTDVNQLPCNEIDVVCVVIKSSVAGGPGTILAKALLAKGIHVIQEHPVHHDEVAACLKIARRSGCRYYLNGFYSDIPTVRQFVRTARNALETSDVIYIDAACSIIVLFPLLDILGQTLGGLRPWDFNVVERSGDDAGPLILVYGRIGGVSLILRVLNQIDPEYPDNSAHFLHRIELCTNSGSLLLTDTHGIVLWNPRMYVPPDENGVLDIYGTGPNLACPVTQMVPPVENRSVKTIFTGLWPESIRRTLERFWETIVSGTQDNAVAQYQLTLCQAWQDLGNRLPLPDLFSTYGIRPSDLEGLAPSTQKNKEKIHDR